MAMKWPSWVVKTVCKIRWPRYVLREVVVLRKGFWLWVFDWLVIGTTAWVFFKIPLILFCHEFLKMDIGWAIIIVLILGNVGVLVFKKYRRIIIDPLQFICAAPTIQFLFRVFS